MANARLAALRLLEQVLLRKQSLDEAMESVADYKNLQGPDRAFARMLTSETLRRYGQITHLIDQHLKKPGGVEPFEAQLILCLGVTQLLFMETSVHAALNETVELCTPLRLTKLKGLVNAVLRNIDRMDKEKALHENSYKENIPEWIYESWVNDYGETEAALIAKASLHQAPTDITLKKPDELKFWKETMDALQLPTGSLRLQNKSGDVASLSGYSDGAWWVQDIAASLPVKLLGDMKDKAVLDLCAAPGGKTMQLAAMGADVTALDRSTGRMRRLKENLERTHLVSHVETVIADALTWKPKALFDTILIDAPCSATGTIRKHPDLLHLKTQKDLSKLITLQAQILECLPFWLNKGGVAVYATCSLQKSEGEEQIERFLEKHMGFARIPINASELGDMEQWVTGQGDMRCLPHHLAGLGGMDGFFAARLTRVL